MDVLEDVHEFKEISEEECKAIISPLLLAKTEKKPEEEKAARELLYRHQHAFRNWQWKPGNTLPYEHESDYVMVKRFWYLSIDRNTFGVGNLSYVDLPEKPVRMCNKCATKTLEDASIRAWAWHRYNGVGHCDICGDDDGLYIDRGGQGYAEGFHSRND
jgi:hypothetical protein